MVRQRRVRRYGEVVRDSRWEPSSVTVLLGEEEFFKRDVLELCLQRTVGSERGVDCLTELTPKSLNDVISAIVDLQTPSFFSETRIVWLRDCSKFLSQAEEKLTAALKKGLSCGFLFLDLPKLDGKTRFGKTVMQRDAAIDCRALWDTPPPWKRTASPYESELHSWVVHRAKKHGIELTLPLAGELVALTGNAPGAIDQELSKLSTQLRGSATPSSEQLLAMVPDRRRDSVFSLLDHTLLGETKQAHASLGRLLRLGYRMRGTLTLDSSSIANLTVGAFTNRLGALRRCHEFFSDKRNSPSDLAGAAIVPRMQVPVVMKQLRRFRPGSIDKAFKILLESDRALKGKHGQNDPATILERVILRIASLAE